ncbi:hypothetical protein GQ607_015178 [Colletotrichum asianum]|uniref:Secreted protein n=1 Tax=Colletotrichum asianum TaxID=702518 RepID=A0A8H3ZIZ2_9PEZI|nr:hypothetical protein GQ607_015178 [Colletotrichum asianum]
MPHSDIFNFVFAWMVAVVRLTRENGTMGSSLNGTSRVCRLQRQAAIYVLGREAMWVVSRAAGGRHSPSPIAQLTGTPLSNEKRCLVFASGSTDAGEREVGIWW